MSIVSNAINKQKQLHAGRPATLPAGRVAQECPCGVWYSLPACHADRHKSCTADCARGRRKQDISARERSCAECGSRFIPRPIQVTRGQGRFCSVSCGLISTRRSPEFMAARPRAIAAWKVNHTPKSGSENPRWTGGPEAARRRYADSGASAARVRKYRKENPEKVREWSVNRDKRKHGRLPRGTVKRLCEMQRGKCANCCTSLDAGFHVDHIMPLARGGQHVPDNIQILCPTCNVRKAARHPIQFAQMHGRLL